MPKLPQSPDEWKTMIFKDWPSRVVLTLLTAFCAFVWSQGNVVVQTKVLEIVKPSIDTLAKKQESTDQKVETVKDEVKKLNDKMDALISIMVESNPQIKKAAQIRVQKNKDSQDVQNALAGDKK